MLGSSQLKQNLQIVVLTYLYRLTCASLKHNPQTLTFTIAESLLRGLSAEDSKEFG